MPRTPAVLFRHCPDCGAPDPSFHEHKRLQCPSCGFEYFHNVATAAGCIILVKDQVLLVVRAQEPARGKLALPGGFVDPGERVEEAILRECREEIGWTPSGPLSFLASFPNEYVYKRVRYNTCDLFFVVSAPELRVEGMQVDPHEVAGVRLASAADIAAADLAFESTRQALRLFSERYR